MVSSAAENNAAVGSQMTKEAGLAALGVEAIKF